jgi:hypothetical protein
MHQQRDLFFRVIERYFGRTDNPQEQGITLAPLNVEEGKAITLSN